MVVASPAKMQAAAALAEVANGIESSVRVSHVENHFNISRKSSKCV